MNKNLFALNIQLFAEDAKGAEKKESEIIQAIREDYEARLQDKDKIIKDLIAQNKKKNTKAQSIIEEDDEDVENNEDVEEKKKQDDEEKKRRDARMEYYKKHIF